MAKPKIETPQEVQVWYVLPAVRKEFMLALMKHGLRQKEVAEMLNVTDAAVSQYMHNKRATSVDFPKELLTRIDESAQKLIAKKSSLQQELQHIMQAVWSTKLICGICRDCTGAANSCQACYPTGVRS